MFARETIDAAVIMLALLLPFVPVVHGYHARRRVMRKAAARKLQQNVIGRKF